MSEQRSPTEPWWMAHSIALYQRLVALYPPAFRRAYGEQVVQTFRDTCRQAVHEHGLPSLCGCWISMFTDLASNALAEWFTEGFSMSRALLIRLAGGLTLVGVVFLLPLMLSARTSIFAAEVLSRNGAVVAFELFSRPSAVLPLVGIVLAACCCAVGLLGITLTQRRRIGRLAGGLALLGQVGLVLYLMVLLWFVSAPWPSKVTGGLSLNLTVLQLWDVLLPLVASLALGLGLVGCSWVMFKTGRFPARSVALLVLGLWVLGGTLGLGWLQWTTPSFSLVAAISWGWTTLFSLYALISCLLWGWLGFTLLGQRPPHEAQAQAALG